MKQRRSVGLVVLGITCCLVGGVWIAQGTGHLSGSVMTGHPVWAYLGAALVVGGIVVLVICARDRRPNEPPEP